MTSAHTGTGLLGMRTLNGRSLVAVVAAGSFISLIGLGVRSTFGVYLDPVVDSLGTDRGMFSLAIAIQNLLWGLSQPVAGALADRFGTTRVLLVGAVGYGASLLVMSGAESSAVFYLSAGFGVGLATGAASFSLVLAAVGRMAPPGRAPLALGVVTAMASVGQLALVPAARVLVDGFGWRTAVGVMAVVAVTVVLAAPVVRGNAAQQQGRRTSPASGFDAQNTSAAAAYVPPEVDAPVVNPLRVELRRAARSRAYILLNAAFFVCGFHVTFIGTHLVSYAGDVGVGAGAATAGLAIIGLFNIIGSLTAGHLGSRYSKTRLLSGIYALRAVVILVFIVVPATGTSVVVFGAAIGVLWLSTVPLTGGIVNGLFGTTHAGTLFGIVFLSHQLGAFTGAWMGGEVADRTGSYLSTWWIAVALGVFAAVVHLMIDESPAAPAPIGDDRIGGGIAPAAGMATVALIAGVAALFQPLAVSAGVESETAMSDRQHNDVGVPVVLCILHPVGEP